MGIIQQLFGSSPFVPLVEHAKKVMECVETVKPLVDALLREDWEEIHNLQDEISRKEYEADRIKHGIREQIPRRHFLPVDKGELENLLRAQDKIADGVEDFAIILLIRKTTIHPDIQKDFLALVEHVLNISKCLLEATSEMQHLAEAAFSGAEAEKILGMIDQVSHMEWESDRMQRRLSMKIYSLEKELDPITILFYEKMMTTLSKIANDAENTADLLRLMIVKG